MWKPIFLLAAAIRVVATVVDPSTGIAFERYQSAQGYNFGIALPQVPTTDFIAQIIYPTTGAGYGGLSLAGAMANSLLVVVWPNGKDVVPSFRLTTGHVAPTIYPAAYAEGSSLAFAPIPSGTYVNATHLSYTFICRGCITGDTLSFHSNASSHQFGYSSSGSAVSSPESPTAATLKFHNLGYGQFQINLNSAKSADYQTWASKANITHSDVINQSVPSETSITPGPASTSIIKPSSRNSVESPYYGATVILPMTFLVSFFLLCL